MSRTFKDRPYWVRANDRKHTEGVYIIHDHLSAGKPVYEKRYIRNSDGSNVMEERSYEYEAYELTMPDGETRTLSAAEAWKVRFEFILEGYYYLPRPKQVTITRTWLVKKTEQVLIGHTPECCTENIPIDGKTNNWGRNTVNLCTPAIPYYSTANWKGTRKFRERSERRSSRDANRSAVNRYNSGDDLWS